ncbi:hypothetical protein GGX14DRAFT_407095 [Mycena pura]|uniref:Uncharacterized protein n=1 Tax=Mycena pura TaxID=153505 RepID=A0AAD6UP91_9AGAR|nr:hypothetical protein GGX14DRAFT_407095 [Mycena pura]
MLPPRVATPVYRRPPASSRPLPARHCSPAAARAPPEPARQDGRGAVGASGVRYAAGQGWICGGQRRRVRRRPAGGRAAGGRAGGREGGGREGGGQWAAGTRAAIGTRGGDVGLPRPVTRSDHQGITSEINTNAELRNRISTPE